jgi:hypothetical protein
MKLILATLIALTTSAHAQLGALVPPAQYDRPYPGKITVTRAEHSQMHKLCAGASPVMPTILYGCAKGNAEHCTIVIVSDDVLDRFNISAEMLLRHERAHCNGWPWHHPR